MTNLRDGNLKSPWEQPITTAAKGAKDQIYDCLIVGAGITGLTAALQLQQNGKQTILIEAHTIGFGTTSGTSAHINTFADTTYAEAADAFGQDGAKLFAAAIAEGFDFIKAHGVNCDYQVKPGYLYAETAEQVKTLDDIFKAAVKAGVAAEYTENVPTPVSYQKALVFPDQAQFHPLKYLQVLASAYTEAGGAILENSRVEKLETVSDLHIAKIGQNQIKGRAVIYATHMPPNINVFNFECAAYRSYVLAAKLKGGHYPDALIYDLQEPYHYIRTHVAGGEKLLLIGGNDHKTGHGDPEKAFAQLEKYARKYYPVTSISYRWSSQYYVPVDGLPYIGHLPMAAETVFCATGYNGNGMMLGSVAGKILADLVSGKKNKYQDLFKPSRIKPLDALADLARENADVAYHFVTDRFTIAQTDSLKRMKPGSGKVTVLGGKKVAAYKDQNGALHTFSPVCTHMGCIVAWNSEEKSWDCPCHGARFDTDGKVLAGPATKDLAAIVLNQNNA